MPLFAALAQSPQSARLQRAASRHPLWLVAFGVVLYSTGPVMVQASDATGPAFSFWRLWIGVPALALLSWLHVRAGGRWPDRRAWRWSAWAGIAFGVHQLLMFSAIKATSVVDVSLMGTLSPIVVAVAAVPLFGERPGLRFRVWTGLAIVGAAVVVLAASTGPEGDPLGMAMAAANVVFFAAFFLVSKQSRGEIAVLPFLFGVITIAAVVVSGYVAITGEPVAAVTSHDLGWAAGVALGPGVVGHFIMTWPLHWVAANIPPIMRLGQPIISGLLAWAFLGEAITLAHFGGGALTLAGVCGAVLSRSGRALSTAAQEGGPLTATPTRRRPRRRGIGSGGG